MLKFKLNLRKVAVIIACLAVTSMFISCKKDDAKQITAFSFTSPSAVGIINEGAKTIAVEVPLGADISTLVPAITISDKATISPSSGVAQNFTNPVIYTVTAEDGSTASYTVTVTEEILKIGQSYQGGIIAYVDGTGKHGLIVAPEDQSPAVPWGIGEIWITTGATEIVFGKGKSNTERIVQKYGNGNYAAKLCYDLILNGYDDWFLPSLNELDMLYRNKDAIGMFYNNNYWCSSESGDDRAWYINFENGSQHNNTQGMNKHLSYRVRAVRYF